MKPAALSIACVWLFAGAAAASRCPAQAQTPVTDAPASPPQAPKESPKTPAAQEAPPSKPLDAELERRLEEIDRRAAKVESLKAKFEQRKHTALLKKPLVSSGTLAVRGDRARWDTLSPHASVTCLDSKELRVYYPEQRTVEIYELGQDVREFAGSPLPRLEKMKATFSIARIAPSLIGGIDEDKDVIAIELTPRSEQLRERVARLRVLIDSKLPAARRMEILDPDGDRTEMVFSDVKLNEKLEPREVTLETPRGVREVRPLAKLVPRPQETGK